MPGGSGTVPGGSAGPGTKTTAGNGPAPVLGAAFAPYQEGYGQVRPALISNGGDPTGVVSGISWQSWGGPQATGSGVSTYVGPSTPSVAQGHLEPVTVVAGNLGTCGGVPAYRAVTWYFPGEGQTLDPAPLDRSGICVPPQEDCRYDLNVAVTQVAGPTDGQGQLKITFTNRTLEACDVTGYPTVTLSGPPPGVGGVHSWTLADQTGPGITVPQVTLGFEQSAFALLTYLPASSGASPAWTPGFLSIALPGTAPPGQAVVWSWHAIVFQASATHPGTYIGPIET